MHRAQPTALHMALRYETWKKEPETSAISAPKPKREILFKGEIEEVYRLTFEFFMSCIELLNNIY